MPCGPHCFRSNSNSQDGIETDQPPVPSITAPITGQTSAAETADQVQIQRTRVQETPDKAQVSSQHDKRDVADLISPATATLYPAGPKTAAGGSPASAQAARHSPETSAAKPASMHSPRQLLPSSPAANTDHHNRGSNAGKPAECSRKRKRLSASPPQGAGAAAAAVASAAALEAADIRLLSSGAGTLSPRHQPKCEQLPGQVKSPTRERQAVVDGSLQSPLCISLVSEDPIVISDSDEEGQHTAKSHVTQASAPAGAFSPTTRLTPLDNARTPGAGSLLRGVHAAAPTPDGSADSPFVIEITESDDTDDQDNQNKHSPKTNEPSIRHAPFSKQASAVKIQHAGQQSTRRSGTHNSRQSKGQARPSAQQSCLQPVPFNLILKGNTAPVSQGQLFGSSQAPVTSSDGLTPTLPHTLLQPGNVSTLHESIRQAARSSALLSVCRPGSSKSSSHPSTHRATASAGTGATC